jgi:arylsulfatase A-like enzyme/Tfp pilus assembly protein PilF
VCFLFGASPRAPEKAPAAKPKRTNVVLITLDTTRADRLGCYGRKDASTPNLDRLAAEGVRFEEAWTPVPITLPSHLTIMTGCYPTTHGVRDNGQSKYDRRIPTLADRFKRAGYATAAVVSASVLDSGYGINAGFGIYDDRLAGRAERRADETTDRALAILKTLDRPFFLWVHYFDPHSPYDPPAPFAAKFAGDPYQGEIAFVDAQIRRLLAGLEQRKDNPLIVVAGDHGESLLEHGERTHGIFTYRSTLRVPLIFAGPGVAKGRVGRMFASLIDIAPTLADLLGLASNAIEDGRLLYCDLGRASSDCMWEDRWLYFESMLPLNTFGWAAPRGVTLEGREALIDLPKKEVYDLSADPGQKKNLYLENPDLSKKLLAAFAAETERLAKNSAAAVPIRLSQEEREKLASLGYLPGPDSGPPNPTLDPKDMVDISDRIDDAKKQLDARHFDEAIGTVRAILARNPENLSALMILGQSYLETNRGDEASKTLRRVVALNPGLAVGRYNLGKSLESLGRIDAAMDEWRRAIELEPHFAEPRAAIIRARLDRGDGAGALAAARDAIKAGAESAELDLEIGLAHASAGEKTDAEKWLSAALTLQPQYFEALVNLAQINYDAHRLDRAIERYREALRVRPDDAPIHKRLGAILLSDKGDAAGALAEFRAALVSETDPVEREKLKAMITGMQHSLGASPRP